jgi:hypothetical protein
MIYTHITHSIWRLNLFAALRRRLAHLIFNFHDSRFFLADEDTLHSVALRTSFAYTIGTVS